MLYNMTSMLYMQAMNQTILPDAVRPGPHYSLAADLKLNAWAFVALGVAFVVRWLLRQHPEWAVLLRASLALTPLIPSLLYVRSISRWIGGMDELQRRIQLQACLFAMTGAVFVRTGLDLLNSGGAMPWAGLKNGLGWEGTFALIMVLYI